MKHLLITLLLLAVFPALRINADNYRDLLEAINKDDPGKLKEIVEADPDVLKSQMKFRNYPLFEAAAKGKTQILIAMVELGADINQKDDAGETAIFPLARTNIYSKNKLNSIIECMKLLKDKGAKLDISNKHGEKPLHFVAAKHLTGEKLPLKIELMQWLIDNGVSPKGDKADPPLIMRPLEQLKSDAKQKEGAIATLKFLIENNAELDAQKGNGDTALIRIIKTECFTDDEKKDLIQTFVNAGASIREKNDSRESPKSLIDRKSPLYDALKKKRR